MFVANQFKGVIPEMVLTSSDYEFISEINRELMHYIQNLEKIQ